MDLRLTSTTPLYAMSLCFVFYQNLYNFVASVTWITFRRPCLDVIEKELGRWESNLHYMQWRSQPNDLVLLCKYLEFCENNQFLKKWMTIIWNLTSGTKLSGWLLHWLHGYRWNTNKKKLCNENFHATFQNHTFSPAARGRYAYHIEGQFHFGFILFL